VIDHRMMRKAAEKAAADLDIAELKSMLLDWHRIFSGADLCAGCIAEWEVSMKRVEEEDLRDEEPAATQVAIIPVGEPREWQNFPYDKLEWLEERITSQQKAMQQMQGDHVSESRLRLLEIKALHLANARNKRAVKSNQAKFNERDKVIADLRTSLDAESRRADDNGDALVRSRSSYQRIRFEREHLRAALVVAQDAYDNCHGACGCPECVAGRHAINLSLTATRSTPHAAS
jgi:hypothetical protein